MKSLKNIFGLAVAIVVCEMAGIVGSLLTASSIQTWYTTLEKPALNPPSWVFGPVWTTLYAMMGVAVFLIWQKGWERLDVRRAVYIFGLQLALNAIWSPIFFGAQNISLALVVIVFLWLAIIWTMVAFYKISKPATYLLVPYLAWVSFATYLNYAYWTLN